MNREKPAQELKIPGGEWLNWPPTFKVDVAAGVEESETCVPAVPASQPLYERVEAVSLSQTARLARICIFDDPTAAEALQEIAGLLAIAFQRYRKIQRVPVDQLSDAVNRELAMSGGQSVHGGGQHQ